MKLTTKQLMFILMSVLLVLVVVMGSIVFSRVGGLFQMAAGPNNDDGGKTPAPSGSSPSSSLPSSVPNSTATSGPPHQHEYTRKTYSPTCDAGGYTLLVCECGFLSTDVDAMTSPLGHNYGPVTVVAATCTEDGWTERTCSRCSFVEKTSPTKAGHTFSLWEEITVPDGMPANQQRTCIL